MLTLRDYALQLKRGSTLNCATPDGLQFQIQSKVADGLTWYPFISGTEGLSKPLLIAERYAADGLAEQRANY